MTKGKCTNLPTECSKALSIELQDMPTSDSRCSECGSLLLEQREFKKTNSNNNLIKLIAFGLLTLLTIGLLAFLLSQFMGKNDSDKPLQPANTSLNNSPSAESNNLKMINNADYQDAEQILNVQGSNTIGSSLMPKFLDGYYSKQGNAPQGVQQLEEYDRKLIYLDNDSKPFAVSLGSHGSSTGIKALIDGSANLAMSSRPIKDGEVAQLADKGMGDMRDASQEYVVGLDGIAIIVHQSNPLNSLTKEQLKGIFAGNYSNWSELGGNDEAIKLYIRDKQSGTRDTFESLVMNKQAVSNASEFEDSNELSISVANDRGGIGYIGLPYINSSKALAIADSANAKAFMPTAFTIATEDYPLSRRLFLYLPQDVSAEVRDLANFAISKDGQQLVKDAGFTYLNPEAIKQPQGQAYDGNNQGYKALNGSGERINVNFRFATNSSQLDNKARQDLNRITSLLDEKQKSGENKRLVLVGFADNQGDNCSNLQLSEQRAKLVAEALSTYGVQAEVIAGVGEDAPVADNATEAGRQKNRRVELWLAPADDIPSFSTTCN